MSSNSWKNYGRSWWGTVIAAYKQEFIILFFNGDLFMLVLNSRSRVFLMLVSVLFCSMAGTAIASDQITISSKFPYLNDQIGNAAARNECTWNTTMPADVVAQSKGAVISTDQDLDTVAGKKLIITVTNLHTAGGMRFSGPKWIALRGELMEDGKLLGNFQLRRATSGGKSTGCKTLDYISKALTQDVLKWLKNPAIMQTPSSDTNAATE
ncbi:MAG: hypothetical protein ABI644_15035 [Arenimonas sp.]